MRTRVLTSRPTSAALNLLVVDPAYQRRGAGRQLVQDGITRAQAAGYPIWLSSSVSGKGLYQALGFELMEETVLTSAKIKHARMLLEAPASVLK
jgi:ribosomal protein S18 acetylase RimI-like enzyme